MSESDDGPGRREIAHRLFAAEFEDVTVSYRESDEERAPNYVVLPTGARVNRAFAVGVLTEVEPVNESVVRARIADPTGAFVSYAGQYQPDALAFFERASPPAVVSITGKARTFEPDDGDRVFSSLRPESVNEVDGDTRDRWIVDAARATLRRVAVTADALAGEARGDDLRAELAAEGVSEALAAGVPLAIERYGVTEAYLEDVRRMAVEALSLVAGERDAVTALSTRPDEDGTAEVGPLPAESTFEPASTAPLETDSAATDGETDTTAVETASDDTRPDGPSAGVSAEPAADAADGSDPDTASEPVGETGVGGAEPEVSSASGREPEPEPEVEPEPDPDQGSTPDPDPEQTAPSGDIGDFDASEFEDDDLYEMDETERAEAEEFGTEFATGTEVDPAGEAGIDVPDEPPEPATEPTAGADTGTDTDAEADTDVDLEDAVVAAMEDLDDGSGADREAVVARVVEEAGATPDDVETAVQDALMSGRCYEPDETTLKPI